MKEQFLLLLLKENDNFKLVALLSAFVHHCTCFSMLTHAQLICNPTCSVHHCTCFRMLTHAQLKLQHAERPLMNDLEDIAEEKSCASSVKPSCKERQRSQECLERHARAAFEISIRPVQTEAGR